MSCRISESCLKNFQVPIHPIPQEKFDSDKKHFPLLPPQAKSKPNIDFSFVQQLGAILARVVLPPSSWNGEGTAPLWKSRQVALICLHSGFLVLRTYLSILVARLDGRIVRDLVKADGKGFLKGMGLWFLLAIPSTYTNSMVSTISMYQPELRTWSKCSRGICFLIHHPGTTRNMIRSCHRFQAFRGYPLYARSPNATPPSICS